MDNEAELQVNSESIAVILTTLGAKSAVLNGLDYPELRLFSLGGLRLGDLLLSPP
jgi:hypothetical protein